MVNIFQNLNTKNEEALVKKLAWRQARSHMKGPQHPDDIEEAVSKSKKIFRHILSQRKIERSRRGKSKTRKQSAKKAVARSRTKKPVARSRTKKSVARSRNKKAVARSRTKKPVAKKKRRVN